jgi:hypothetical protein
MNFSPGGNPICIDTGASSCILNNKSDFIDIKPKSNTVLKGIGSGLHIAGTGTLCWKIVDDIGDKVSLHICDSLYVPSTLMCLLSPQTVAQQTNNLHDGFIAKSSYGRLSFSGHTKTIHYNNHNNLPIFFMASVLSTPPSPIDNLTGPSPSSYIASEIIPDTTINLTPTQSKLLLKHHQLGHLHMY